MNTTYDVKVLTIEKRKNAAGKVTSYRVHWTVDGERWKESFPNAAQADSFRSDLIAAARRGEAFRTDTGRPASHARKAPGPTWYTFALSYVDSKWPYASPNHRRGISESVIDATEVLLLDKDGKPDGAQLRDAMRWATSVRVQSQDSEPPYQFTAALRWLERNTVPMTAFAEPGAGSTLARAVLDRISRKQDKTIASASTAMRKRAVLNNLMGYAVETDVLAVNPLKAVKWVKPKIADEVDVRTVVNREQAGRLLATVRKLPHMGPRLEAFFGCMYYAALRPEEVIGLRRDDLISLPKTGWGEMRLRDSDPKTGKRWTSNGKSRERRQLKHRAIGETRPVPIHPDLVRLLRKHLEQFPTASGEVFRGPRGGTIADSTYLPYFHKARTAAFTPDEAVSPLAGTPYALRHAAVSTWLNAGVPATQVAEWAGHTVEVLLRVYAKCIAGQDQEAKRRILEATTSEPEPPDEDEDAEPGASERPEKTA
ncbi:MAG TPA: tyrosine-type recombinase/integrase [Actinocrinis sp.]|jgi:integrase